MNQRNYKIPAMQTHALTHTYNFYSLYVIISHPIVYTDGLGSLSICAITMQFSLSSHMYIHSSHPGPELCCVHRTWTQWKNSTSTMTSQNWKPKWMKLKQTQSHFWNAKCYKQYLTSIPLPYIHPLSVRMPHPSSLLPLFYHLMTYLRQQYH